MAVHPDYQHQGIATRLIEALWKRLSQRGGTLIIYTLDDEPANQLYLSIGAKLCYNAAIVHGHSKHNHVPMRADFKVTPNKTVAIYTAEGVRVAYTIDEESYYFGDVRDVRELTSVDRIVKENVYLLDL